MRSPAIIIEPVPPPGPGEAGGPLWKEQARSVALRGRPTIFDPVPRPGPGEAAGPLWKKLAWFVALAVAASAVTAIVAYGLRALPFMG